MCFLCLFTGFGSSTTAGKYPIVFVRTMSDDKPTNFVIEAGVYLFDIEFGAPLQFEIAGVIDGDGAGNYEIIMSAGTAILAYSIKANKPKSDPEKVT